MQLTRRIRLICVGLYLFAQLLFLVNIQFPRGYCFDEFHYVPSAKQFIAMTKNQNYEHPPLGKMLMAVGIAIGEDRPFGWRLMSTVFGALTLVGMFLWGLAVFRDEGAALLVAGISLVNQMLYVQARIGMLDTFMFAFMVWGLAAFCAAWDPRLEPARVRRYFLFTGVLFGLSAATKWFAVIPWLFCLGLIVLIRVFQKWNVRFAGDGNASAGENDWYHPDLWKGVRIDQVFLLLVVVPVVVYFLTFTPFFFIQEGARSLFDLWRMQVAMYDGQLRVVSSHPYMSNWYTWPLMLRPIWYAFDKEGDAHEWVRGVIFLGNPLVMWSGLAAVGMCVWAWVTRRARAAFLITGFYFVFYLCWGVIPRKIAFYYYYYPAGMTLSLALTYVFHSMERGKPMSERWGHWMFLAAALGVFIHFFPILSGIRIAADAYRHWMWMSSWI